MAMKKIDDFGLRRKSKSSIKKSKANTKLKYTRQN